jgi:hypothetical protein
MILPGRPLLFAHCKPSAFCERSSGLGDDESSRVLRAMEDIVDVANWIRGEKGARLILLREWNLLGDVQIFSLRAIKFDPEFDVGPDRSGNDGRSLNCPSA